MLLKIGAAFLIVLALFLYLTKVHPVAALSVLPPSVSLTPLTASAILSASTPLLPFTTTGVAFIDTTSGAGIPFLLYETQGRHAGVKELLFSTTNTCAIAAGGYSCSIPSDELGTSALASNEVSPGDIVTVSSFKEDQGIQVSSLSQTQTLPDGITEVRVTSGQSITTQGITITPGDLLSGASCTLGVGCMGAAENRIPVTIKSSGTRSTELLPGTLYSLGNKLLVLLSATHQQGVWVYGFAVAQN
jgi:hypothetical protein